MSPKAALLLLVREGEFGSEEELVVVSVVGDNLKSSSNSSAMPWKPFLLRFFLKNPMRYVYLYSVR